MPSSATNLAVHTLELLKQYWLTPGRYADTIPHMSLSMTSRIMEHTWYQANIGAFIV